MKKNDIMSELELLYVRPCVGCGFCCMKSPCELAHRVYTHIEKECPSLKWSIDKNRYVCDLVVNENFTYSLRQYYKERLFIGEGCCCNLNSWRSDVKPRRDYDIIDENNVIQVKSKPIDYKKVFEEFLHSMAKQFMSGDVIALTCYSLGDKLRNLGFTDDEVERVMEDIKYNFFEHRASRIKDFMG